MKKTLDKLRRAVDRVISGGLGKQLLFFLAVATAVFALLLAARALLYPPPPDETGDLRFWDMVFNFIDVGGFENSSGFERWLIFLTNLSGMILFGGGLVALLTNTIFQRIENVGNGEAFYDFSGHAVVIGFNSICGGLVSQLADKGEVVVMVAENVPAVREALFAVLSQRQEKNVTLVRGNRVSRESIERLHIEKCKEVFLLGESGEDAHDSRNIECLQIISAIAAAAALAVKLRCCVLFNDHLTFAAFQREGIPGIDNIDFVPFNFCDEWAQKVFVDNSYHGGKAGAEITYAPLDREPITEDSPMRVHLVILGMSNMGVSLGMQAAQLCHFPNFVTRGVKTLITFIDENADVEMASLKRRLRPFFDEVVHRYRDLGGYETDELVSSKEYFTDIEVEFIKARFQDPSVTAYIEEAAADKNSYLTIAAAVPDSTEALEAALYLSESVYDSEAAILVRQQHSHAIVSMLARVDEVGDAYRKYRNLRPFGMLENSYDLHQADDLLPMMVKFAYDYTTAATIKHGGQVTRDFPEGGIRSNWVSHWRPGDNVSALKASNRCAANFIKVKQRSLGIKAGVDLDPRQALLAAAMEHNRWVAEKLLMGFRAPTPEEAGAIAPNRREFYKARFIHQDIKPYGDLGDNEKNLNVRAYDINISNALPWMIKAYGERKVGK